MTEDDRTRRLRSDLMWKYDEAMGNMFQGFADVMHERQATLDETCDLLERFCDWDTSSQFRDWYGEANG